MYGCEELRDLELSRLMAHDLKLVSPLVFNLKEVAKAQRSWEGYFQSECQLVFDSYYPGTAAPFEKAKCELELTENRIEELQPLIHVEQYS